MKTRPLKEDSEFTFNENNRKQLADSQQGIIEAKDFNLDNLDAS